VAKLGTTYVTRKTISRITSTISTRVHQRDEHLFAHGERELLISDKALEDFGEAAGFFAGHHGSDVDLGEDALQAEGFRQQRAAADFFANGIDVGLEFRVRQTVGEQVQGFQDGQAGANQRDELLVEDEELVEVEFAAAAGDVDLAAERKRSSLRLDRVDEEALLRIALPDFLAGRALDHLVVDLTGRIGVFEDEFGHWLFSVSTAQPARSRRRRAG
jgi:hypothetical protein